MLVSGSDFIFPLQTMGIYWGVETEMGWDETRLGKGPPHRWGEWGAVAILEVSMGPHGTPALTRLWEVPSFPAPSSRAVSGCTASLVLGSLLHQPPPRLLSTPSPPTHLQGLSNQHSCLVPLSPSPVASGWGVLEYGMLKTPWRRQQRPEQSLTTLPGLRRGWACFPLPYQYLPSCWGQAQRR